MIRNEAGFSIVGMMAGVAVSIAVSTAVISLFLNHSRQVSSLRNRLDIQSLRDDLKLAFRNEAVCMSNFGSLRINAPGFNSSYALTVPAISDASEEVLRVGQNAKRAQIALVVRGIRLVNWRQTSVPDKFKFDLEAQLASADEATLPLRIRGLVVYTNPASPAGAKIPVRCGAGLLPVATSNCRIVSVDGPPGLGEADAGCGVGETLRTGGGACLSSGGTEGPGDTWMQKNAPMGQADGTVKWRVECASDTQPNAPARAYAVCCR